MEIEVPDDIGERVTKIAKVLMFQGRAAAAQEVQRQLIPHIMEVFAEHDEETVYQFIVTDYALVENDLPQPIKNALWNLAQNGHLRPVYHQWVLDKITPENVLDWMRHPDKWLDDDAADEQRERLQSTARKIEETPGGHEWLEARVWTLYQYAQVVPEDSNPQGSMERV